MKKLIAVVLCLFMMAGVTLSLSSCLPPVDDNINNNVGNNQGNSGNIDSDENTDDDESGTQNPENPDPENPDPENPDPENSDDSCVGHIDYDNNDYCDLCSEYVIVVLDFYSFNDLHGKFCDTATQPGVDEIGTYFENRREFDDNIILLSTGDMWQGSAESILSNGKIIVDWMNALGFVAMTLGNHEYDWGEEAIRSNITLADFPFLAINIYDNSTGKLADYCTPSIMVERDGIQIGIIGAIGDCYSSISSDMVENVTFKVGSELTSLVKDESQRLRSVGADIIIYSLHDGTSGYDNSLSNGYIDLVFEGHTHQSYSSVDSYGVYHIQGGGENYGFSHIEIAINGANGNKKVTEANVITTGSYSNLEDHLPTEEIEDKYSEIIDYAYADLGYVSKTYGDSEIEDFVAQLYLEAGLEKWGDEYDIVLGGGFLRTRTPYNLTSGTKKYSDLLSLFPFNNPLVLCSISGRNLKNKFINSSSSDYHIALSDYGNGLSVNNSGTYYVVVDTYTAFYAPNGLTIIEYYDNETYARDLLADALVAGRLGGSQQGGNSQPEEDNRPEGEYSFTSIPEALAIGNALGNNQSTSEYYYIKGTVKSNPQSTYGNLYLVDENGNEIYVYGLYDASGVRYDSMEIKPQMGDEIILYSIIYKYSNGSTVTVELKSAKLLEII